MDAKQKAEALVRVVELYNGHDTTWAIYIANYPIAKFSTQEVALRVATYVRTPIEEALDDAMKEAAFITAQDFLAGVKEELDRGSQDMPQVDS